MPPACRTVLATLALAAALGAAVALALSAAYSPEAMAAAEPIRALGLPAPAPCPGCPLCGMSRAFAAASRLDLDRAVGFHPGVLLAYPAFVAAALAGPLVALRALRSSSRPHARLRRSA